MPRDKPIKRKRGTVDPQEYTVVKEAKPTVCYKIHYINGLRSVVLTLTNQIETRREGESFRDFHARVNIEGSDLMAKALKQTHNHSKEYFKKKRHLKAEAKIRKREEKADPDDFGRLKDNVKFGEVADAPPTFTALPRRADKLQNKAAVRSDLIL